MNTKAIVTKDSLRRQEEVLAIIVRHYVDTAEPVGSWLVSRKLGLSSATIRNVMADLEEAGLITHPHTSAGRIPTDKGYRYYIDSIMRLKVVNEAVVRMIHDQYHTAFRSLEDALERASHLMSILTNYVGVTLFSEYERLYLDGTSHIVEQPEFHDFKKLYAVLRCLEEKRDLLNLLRHDFGTDSLTVHIGKESGLGLLDDCSVVTRGYKIKGKPSGRIGVIGPKRMLYEKVIPTVEFVADALTEVFEDLRI